MKRDVKTSLVQLEKDELKKLCSQVEETVATEINLPAKETTSFGITNLWRLQRSIKSAGRSRALFIRG
jgi:hypothetical protein